MPKNSAMICPTCKVEMNHHSDKVVYATEQIVSAQLDPSLVGLIKEFHSCPNCGGGGGAPRLDKASRIVQ
jgi:ribosomal protein S27AE